MSGFLSAICFTLGNVCYRCQLHMVDYEKVFCFCISLLSSHWHSISSHKASVNVTETAMHSKQAETSDVVPLTRWIVTFC